MSDEPGPRLAPTTADEWDEETAALIGAVGPLNLFTTLARHPKLLKRWMVFGGHILTKSTLPRREREIVILRVGWRCSCAYEFGQHTLIGRQCGVTDDEIVRLTEPAIDSWSVDDAALVSAADELVARQVLSDATWEALAARWDTEQVLDLIFTIGQYVLVCMALNSLRVELDDGVPGFPANDGGSNRGTSSGEGAS